MNFCNSNRNIAFCYEIAADIDFRSYLFCNDTFKASNVLKLSRVDEINLPKTSESKYISPFRYTNGLPVAEIWVEDDEVFIASGEAMRFHVVDNVIHWWKSAEISEQIFIQRFLSTVLAYILERNGFPVLHASAINIDNQAVGFLANSGGGKTTLAAEFVANGYPLLTDDMLALNLNEQTPLALPAYPIMKLDEQVARLYIDDTTSLSYIAPLSGKLKVCTGSDFGQFYSQPLPLKRLYLPVRQQADTGINIKIHTLTPVESLMRLISQSFAARIVAALGWDPLRIPMFAQLLQTISVKEVVFPSGLQHLPVIREAVLADLNNK